MTNKQMTEENFANLCDQFEKVSKSRIDIIIQNNRHNRQVMSAVQNMEKNYILFCAKTLSFMLCSNLPRYAGGLYFKNRYEKTETDLKCLWAESLAKIVQTGAPDSRDIIDIMPQDLKSADARAWAESKKMKNMGALIAAALR